MNGTVKRVYIPFREKQTANAWQLGVLPCVFGILFYHAVQLAAAREGSVAIAALLGLAAAVLALLLGGGLRASAIGLDLFLLYKITAVFFMPRQPQNAFAYDNTPAAVLAAALGAYAAVYLTCLLLPAKAINTHARQNFRSFFCIAGPALALYSCWALL